VSLRVSIQWTDFEHLFDSAFEQIRMYSKSDVAVSLRLLRAFGDIAITSQDAVFRKILFDRGRKVVKGCSEQMGTENLQPLLARLAAVEKLAANEARRLFAVSNSRGV
jgi:uncharacterized membrane protein